MLRSYKISHVYLKDFCSLHPSFVALHGLVLWSHFLSRLDETFTFKPKSLLLVLASLLKIVWTPHIMAYIAAEHVLQYIHTKHIMSYWITASGRLVSCDMVKHKSWAADRDSQWRLLLRSGEMHPYLFVFICICVNNSCKYCENIQQRWELESNDSDSSHKNIPTLVKYPKIQSNYWKT